MSDKKISELTALTAPDGTEELVVNDSGTSKKITQTNLLSTALPLAGGTMTGTIAGFTSTGIDDNATSTAITIDASENVGIGTSVLTTNTAIKELHVSSPATNGVAQLKLSAPVENMEAKIMMSGYLGQDSLNFGLGNTGLDSSITRMSIGTTGDVTVNTGNLVIGTSGKGIDFSATSDGSGTMTSEVLDDYEEGTWTPTLAGSVTAGSTNYFVQVGRYEKIGRQVTIRGRIAVNLKGTLDGDVSITGLPYTSSATSGAHGILNFGYASSLGITASESLTCLMGLSATSGVIRIWNATTGTSNLDDSEIGDATSLYFEGSYHVD
jgi:hypothetical protein